jgi:electron transport complex protein RnfE
VVKENPALILMLGMCPTLAVTTSATNGLGMGVSTMVVLIASNLLISLLRKLIPDEVRLPAYIVIVASLVTVVELLIEAYIPTLYSALGIYIPLIVVNCIILGRAEAYASKNPPFLSVMDGVGMGLGFTIALTIIGLLREFLGAGTLFGFSVLPDSIEPIAIFVKAPGAFMVIAIVIAVMNAAGMMTKANEKVEGCDGCCAACASSCSKEEKEEP